MVSYDFYVHTYKDDETNILNQIKLFHSAARVFVVSDEKDRLKNKSVRWITRWWDVVRENDSKLIVKVDPDSTILGSFKTPLPDADFFGKIIRYENYGEEKKSCIHGGYGQFLSRRFIDLAYDQVTDEKFWKKEFLYRDNMLSVDKVLAYLAKENNIPLVEYDSNITRR